MCVFFCYLFISFTHSITDRQSCQIGDSSILPSCCGRDACDVNELLAWRWRISGWAVTGDMSDIPGQVSGGEGAGGLLNFFCYIKRTCICNSSARPGGRAITGTAFSLCVSWRVCTQDIHHFPIWLLLWLWNVLPVGILYIIQWKKELDAPVFGLLTHQAAICLLCIKTKCRDEFFGTFIPHCRNEVPAETEQRSAQCPCTTANSQICYIIYTFYRDNIPFRSENTKL